MVPRLSCPTSPPKGDGYQYDLGGSFWVGINGFPNNNPKTPAIEQDGLDFFVLAIMRLPVIKMPIISCSMNLGLRVLLLF
jgi:hypothetical protein